MQAAGRILIKAHHDDMDHSPQPNLTMSQQATGSTSPSSFSPLNDTTRDTPSQQATRSQANATEDLTVIGTPQAASATGNDSAVDHDETYNLDDAMETGEAPRGSDSPLLSLSTSDPRAGSQVSQNIWPHTHVPVRQDGPNNVPDCVQIKTLTSEEAQTVFKTFFGGKVNIHGVVTQTTISGDVVMEQTPEGPIYTPLRRV